MSDAEETTADAPRHRIRVHRRAEAEYLKLGVDADIDALKQALRECATHREPRHHRAAEDLEGPFDGFRVRVGGLRAICALRPPVLLVLKVGKRDGFYEELGVAERRLGDWDGGEATDV